MSHLLYIDPVTCDEVFCNEENERRSKEHWKEVARTMAELVLEDRPKEASMYAKLIVKAT